MHHGHGPGGPHGRGNSPHGPHAPHGPHGHSPHGHAFGHEKHSKDKGYTGNQNVNIQPKQPPQPQAFPQNNTGYGSHQQGYPNQPQQPYPPQQNTCPQYPGYNQQQGSYPQPGGFPQYPQNQGGYYQQQKVPESAHEHPLNYANGINDTCKICQQNIAGQPGYNCASCKVILCLNCAQKIFYGNKKTTIHPHTLVLRFRNAWKCDLCKKNHKGVASFYCKQCDFDACSSCYVSF